MQEENIKTLSFGCRLNALENEKIKNMLSPVLTTAIIVNSCSVTAEAERQSLQAIRKLARENQNAPIFVTGCAATRNPGAFQEIQNCIVIDNKQKMNLDAYLLALENSPCHHINPEIQKFKYNTPALSKQFVQIQNGCNHACSYCVTRLLRGKKISFEYEDILKDVLEANKNGFFEIVLTGVDIASYTTKKNNKPFLISDLCKKLLADAPEIQRLRLSSTDPASPEIFKIIQMMKENKKMMPHLHLSMQSGNNQILNLMRRRHNADTVRKIMTQNDGFEITFSWDIICGFPGETDEFFQDTFNLAQELKPIKIHAFPYSVRPDTEAATMSNQIDKKTSKQRVKIISDIADKNRLGFMKAQIGQKTQVLVEAKNWARTPGDIPTKINGAAIKPRTITEIKILEISDLHFVGEIC